MKYLFIAALLISGFTSCKKEDDGYELPVCDYGFEGGKCEVETAVKFMGDYVTESPSPVYDFEIKRIIGKYGHVLIKNVTNEGYDIEAEVWSGYMMNRDLTIKEQSVSGHVIKGSAYLNSITPRQITINLTIDGTALTLKARGE